jgi:hypothetical protein
MAKKTTKTPAKTATKKPVTMAERVKRIELDVNRHGASMAVQMSAMREHVDLLHEDTIAQIESNRVRLIKIERLLSTPQDVTGTPVDIKVTIPEQGLEPGDYTDASKEVADALTAMGFKMMWAAYTEYPFISFNERVNEVFRTRHENTVKITPAEFLSRAAVTAKKLSGWWRRKRSRGSRRWGSWSFASAMISQRLVHAGPLVRSFACIQTEPLIRSG